MRLDALLLVLCLASCNSLPTASDSGLLDNTRWRQQQAVRDANAILKGMHEAQVQSESLAKRTPNAPIPH